MTTNDDKWWDAQSAEYVLGTLRETERDVFEKILKVDDDVRQRVNYWERKLGVLEHNMPARKPPEPVLPTLMRRIRATERKSTAVTEPGPAQDLTGTWTEELEQMLAADTSPTPHSGPNPAQQHNTAATPEPEHRHQAANDFAQRSRSGNRLWKVLTLFSVAVMLLLGSLFMKQKNQTVAEWHIPDSGHLSIVQDDDQQALWLVTLAGNASMATVVALVPPPLAADRSHQLWVVRHDDAGVSSLGLLPRSSGQSRKLSLPVTIEQAASFAVSAEPAAGSPEPVPTGPLLFYGVIQTIGKSSL